MKPLQRFWRKLKEEKGAETIEFLGMLPVVMITIAIVWQFALLGYTAVITAGAAREGARAAAVGNSCQAAAANASIGWDGGVRRVNCSCGGQACTATVQLQIKKAPIPLISSLPNYPWVSSTAVMRYEPPYN
ncbi:MAG: hypothetical protein QNJ45_14580 [Ardenticatenaceae bacterium]|nr:hypothetical protein [Ardenticatenaceae bacterium]